MGEIVGGVAAPLGPGITRGVRGVARGMAQTAVEEAPNRTALLAEQRSLKTLVQEGRATAEQEGRLVKVQEFLQRGGARVIPAPAADLRAGLEQSSKTPAISGPGAAKLNSMF